MDLNYLRRLVKIFDDSKATELLLEEEGLKLKLAKKEKNSMNFPFNQANAQIIPSNPSFTIQDSNQNVISSNLNQADIQTIPSTEDKSLIKSEEDNLHKIYSPLVGTFYRAPSPDSEPFVQVGSHIHQGSTLCIIEAMKLMNELESDVSGTIVKILQENGQPVEYNQLLFLVKPD